MVRHATAGDVSKACTRYQLQSRLCFKFLQLALCELRGVCHHGLVWPAIPQDILSPAGREQYDRGIHACRRTTLKGIQTTQPTQPTLICVSGVDGDDQSKELHKY